LTVWKGYEPGSIDGTESARSKRTGSAQSGALRLRQIGALISQAMGGIMGKAALARMPARPKHGTQEKNFYNWFGMAQTCPYGQLI
jgi:hypothetical protein